MPRAAAIAVYSVVCGLHGFLYGTLYAPVQALFFGFDFSQTVAWIVAGFPFDVIHGIGNIIFGCFVYRLAVIMKKYDFTDKDALENLTIDEEIWRGVRQGKFLPSKNLIFSIVLAAHMSYDDTEVLLTLAGIEWNFAVVKDVILCYLLQQKVYNAPMIERALTEYKVSNLFLK